MRKEIEDKVFLYYAKVTSSISVKISRNIIENGGNGMLTSSELDDKVGDIINNYSRVFLRYDPENHVLTGKELDIASNSIRENLLDLSAISDFIPDEAIVAFIAKEVVGLIVYANTLEDE